MNAIWASLFVAIARFCPYFFVSREMACMVQDFAYDEAACR